MQEENARVEQRSTETSMAGQAAQPVPTFVRLPNLPSLYVNSAQVALGQLEIRVYLYESTPNRETQGRIESITVHERLCLILPPEFAKQLADTLSRTCEMFEKNFGKLRVTPTGE